MSRARYPDPTPEEIAQQQQTIATLRDYAAGRVPITTAALEEIVLPILGLAEHGGEPYGVPGTPVSWYLDFKPHTEAAWRAGNYQLLAALSLALVLIRQFERHMPDYAEMIRRKQQPALDLARKRRDEGKNALTYIEAWEREKDRPLSPKSPVDDIANCAAMFGLKEPTIRNALYRRERQRRAAEQS